MSLYLFICPVFLAPFNEEIVLSPLYILGSFKLINHTYVFISGIPSLFHWAVYLCLGQYDTAPIKIAL